MPVRVVAFDFGGVLEFVPDEREPIAPYTEMTARWEPREWLQPGELVPQLRQVNERLASMGKDGELGMRAIHFRDTAQAIADIQGLPDPCLNQADSSHTLHGGEEQAVGARSTTRTT